jgi:hypothetical protein
MGVNQWNGGVEPAIETGRLSVRAIGVYLAAVAPGMTETPMSAGPRYSLHLAIPPERRRPV